jgi:hypothetical protein
MRPTEVLQEIRKMRFEDVYEGWNARRLTQAEAAQILGGGASGASVVIGCDRKRRGWKVCWIGG